MSYYAKFKAGGTRKTFLRHSAYKYSSRRQNRLNRQKQANLTTLVCSRRMAEVTLEAVIAATAKGDWLLPVTIRDAMFIE